MRSTLPDRLAQPGKEADEHHGADPPDHAAPTNTTDRTDRPGRTAEAAAPDRAAEAQVGVVGHVIFIRGHVAVARFSIGMGEAAHQREIIAISCGFDSGG